MFRKWQAWIIVVFVVLVLFVVCVTFPENFLSIDSSGDGQPPTPIPTQIERGI